MMSFLKLTYVTALLAAACLITSVAPDGLGMWRNLAELLHALQREERLQTDQHLLTQSQKAMESILSELADGRISLHEATAALRDAYTIRSAAAGVRLNDYWGQTADTRWLRWTFMLAESRLTGDDRERVLRRLHDELHDSLSERHDVPEGMQ